MKRILLLLLFTLQLFGPSMAQDLNFEEIESEEITKDLEGLTPSFTNMGKNGLLIFSIEQENLKIKNNLSAIVIDANLKKSDKISYMLEGKSADGFISNSYEPLLNKYFLLIDRSGQKNDLVCFDIKKRAFQSFKVELKNNFERDMQPLFKVVSLNNKPHFLVFDKKTFLAEIDFETEKLEYKPFPDFFKDKKIESITAVDNEHFLIKYNYKAAKNFALVDKNLDVVIEEILTVTNTKKTFDITSFSIKSDDNSVNIYGTYNLTESWGSSGLISARIEKSKLTYSKLFSFNQLKHFFEFVNEDDRAKMTKDAQKSSYTLDWNIATVSARYLNEEDDKLTLSFSLAGREYRESNWSSKVKSNSTALFLMHLNPKTGELISDKIKLMPQSVKYLSIEKDSSGDVTYYYINDEKIRTVIYSEDNMEEGEDVDLSVFLSKSENLYYSGALSKWYDNFFYCITSKTKDNSILIRKIGLTN